MRSVAPLLARDFGVQRPEPEWQPPAPPRPSDEKQPTGLRRIRVLLTSLVVR